MKYLEYNGKIISGISIADTEFRQRVGLMFKLRILQSNSLLFDLKKPTIVSVHTLFVFHKIDVIFLNENYKILKVSTLNPFIGFTSMPETRYVIESKSGTIKRFNLHIGSQLQIKTF